MMTLIRWDPFRDFMSLQNEVARVFERAFKEGGESQVAWAPAVDVFETDSEITVKADLPQVQPADMEVTFEDDHLIIEGERKFEEEVSQDNFYRLERRYGNFRRAIPITVGIKQDEIKASFSSGVLEVSLPKSEVQKGKQVKVEIEADNKNLTAKS